MLGQRVWWDMIQAMATAMEPGICISTLHVILKKKPLVSCNQKRKEAIFLSKHRYLNEHSPPSLLVIAD